VQTRAAIATAWAVAVLVTSLQPASGGGLPPTGPFGLLGSDRWVHAAGYGVLTALVAWATVPTTARRYLGAFGVVSGYGCLVELLQVPLATRTGDPVDALANAAGTVAVLVAWYAFGLSDRLSLATADAE